MQTNYEAVITELEEELSDLKEKLFLCESDLANGRTKNIELKNFIQNLYESCEAMEGSELELKVVIDNLKQNIHVFARDNNIKL